MKPFRPSSSLIIIVQFLRVFRVFEAYIKPPYTKNYPKAQLHEFWPFLTTKIAFYSKVSHTQTFRVCFWHFCIKHFLFMSYCENNSLKHISFHANFRFVHMQDACSISSHLYAESYHHTTHIPHDPCMGAVKWNIGLKKHISPKELGWNYFSMKWEQFSHFEEKLSKFGWAGMNNIIAVFNINFVFAFICLLKWFWQMQLWILVIPC